MAFHHMVFKIIIHQTPLYRKINLILSRLLIEILASIYSIGGIYQVEYKYMSFFKVFPYKRFCQSIRTYGIFSLYLYYNIKVGNIKCLTYIIKVTLLDKCTFKQGAGIKANKPLVGRLRERLPLYLLERVISIRYCPFDTLDVIYRKSYMFRIIYRI